MEKSQIDVYLRELTEHSWGCA